MDPKAKEHDSRHLLAVASFGLAIALTACASRPADPGNAGKPSMDAPRFVTDLSSVRLAKRNAAPTAEEITLFKLCVHNSYLPEHCWPQIIELWLSEDDDALLRVWWETDNPETRLLIVSLFWSLNNPPPSREDWPSYIVDFEAKAASFAPRQAEARQAECAWVRRNLPEISRRLLALFRDRPSPRATKLKDNQSTVTPAK